MSLGTLKAMLSWLMSRRQYKPPGDRLKPGIISFCAPFLCTGGCSAADSCWAPWLPEPNIIATDIYPITPVVHHVVQPLMVNHGWTLWYIVPKSKRPRHSISVDPLDHFVEYQQTLRWPQSLDGTSRQILNMHGSVLPSGYMVVTHAIQLIPN